MNQKPDKLIPSLYGGVIMAVISAIPFLNFINCFCCAGIMLGGFLGVFFYKNNFTPGTPPLTSGDCLAVGALSGVFGAVIGTLLAYASLMLFGNIMGEFLFDMIRNMNLEIPQEALDAMEESMSAGLTFVSMFMQLIMNLVIDSIFGLLGGLIAYSVYKPKGVITPPAPMPPPPPVQ
ncbi:MAG: hypothetical protein HY964_07075 [Ignavibacteriales bacterium]|nr:hypothetical protein [Ignavibacteriales bacterium]